jgi:hypothetical protein
LPVELNRVGGGGGEGHEEPYRRKQRDAPSRPPWLLGPVRPRAEAKRGLRLTESQRAELATDLTTSSLKRLGPV